MSVGLSVRAALTHTLSLITATTKGVCGAEIKSTGLEHSEQPLRSARADKVNSQTLANKEPKMFILEHCVLNSKNMCVGT